MGRSRRRLSRPKVRVGLPKKKPGVFKPAFTIPKELLLLETSSPSAGGGEEEETKRVWNNKGTYLRNYRTFGVVANPNLLSVRARTPAIVQSAELQLPIHDAPPVSEFDSIDNGSDLEAEDLKSALGKRRRDGKMAPLPPLTTVQRVYVGRLIEKYDDNYEAMFMDIKLNSMQHSVATLKKLCQRSHVHGKHFITS